MVSSTLFGTCFEVVGAFYWKCTEMRTTSALRANTQKWWLLFNLTCAGCTIHHTLWDTRWTRNRRANIFCWISHTMGAWNTRWTRNRRMDIFCWISHTIGVWNTRRTRNRRANIFCRISHTMDVWNTRRTRNRRANIFCWISHTMHRILVTLICTHRSFHRAYLMMN